MRAEPKLRPSMTATQLKLISECLDFRVQNLAIAGQLNSPVVLDLLELKAYCDSLQPRQSMAAAMLAQYMQTAGTSDSATNPASLANPAIITTVSQSPLDNPALNEDQIFDLLSLRDESSRTKEENEWFLAKGFYIKLKRAGMNKDPIDSDDL